ncbi:MAG: hypothetical protein I3273_05960 [Candidatus Moeniiplasma glomeromycotorum]|nr:hypothetical protein [Candidatus Moeniiplasma glomeromycotorum]MCE8168062.1 hypothetical protein [Candidatus Moeniiplasma glomeromycotorum]MCE8169629.1 hypothetical protein [Candidatus Moeniiplasma glomeromycotorum]
MENILLFTKIVLTFLAILSSLLFIYRKLKEKGKIIKLKEKLRKKSQQIKQIELEKSNLERKNTELVAENQKLKREKEMENKIASSLENAEVINQVIIENFKIESDTNFLNSSPRALEILKTDLDLNAQMFYGNSGWRKTAFCIDENKDKTMFTLTMETEGAREPKINKKLNNPIFFCRSCKRSTNLKKYLIHVEGPGSVNVSKVCSDCKPNVKEVNLYCPRTGSSGRDDWTKPRYDCTCVYASEFSGQRLWD